MSFWGKIIGATAGLAIGGPLGALMGGVVGHYGFDRDEEEGGKDPTTSATFVMGMIALSAKMAKADGQVTRDEIAAFRKVFDVSAEDARMVGRVFDMARQDVAGFESYAAQIAKLLKDRPGVMEDVLDALFFIALADGEITEAELGYLARVAEIFGFSEFEFERIAGTHLPQSGPDPYTLLGIERSATDAEVKQAWRRQVQENHPDRMIARGVPEEFVKMANEKLAAINAAYEQISAQRKLS